MKNLVWQHLTDIFPHEITCGFCSRHIAPHKGWRASDGSSSEAKILVCPNCNRPNFVDNFGEQFPGTTFGAELQFLPTDIDAVYSEARRCMAVNSFTGAVLLCRKLLMHIAVEKEAEEDKSFAYYVNYLSENGYVTKGSEAWVNAIRETANEATHKIIHANRPEAELIVEFSEMILKNIYEYPAKLTLRVNSASQPE